MTSPSSLLLLLGLNPIPSRFLYHDLYQCRDLDHGLSPYLYFVLNLILGLYPNLYLYPVGLTQTGTTALLTGDPTASKSVALRQWYLQCLRQT
jgi:hypothetical protein